MLISRNNTSALNSISNLGKMHEKHRRQNQIYCYDLKSMLMFSNHEDTVHEESVPPCQMLNHQVLQTCWSKAFIYIYIYIYIYIQKKYNQDCRFTMTRQQCTRLCQCEHFWVLKTLLWFQTLPTCLIQPTVISFCFQELNCRNEDTISRMPPKLRNNQ